MQRKVPIVGDNTTELKYGNGSQIIGVQKGENQVRLYHPYGNVSDESAFQPDFRECFNAVRPVPKQVICVSSDNLGPMGIEQVADCRSLIESNCWLDFEVSGRKVCRSFSPLPALIFK